MIILTVTLKITAQLLSSSHLYIIFHVVYDGFFTLIDFSNACMQIDVDAFCKYFMDINSADGEDPINIFITEVLTEQKVFIDIFVVLSFCFCVLMLNIYCV